MVDGRRITAKGTLDIVTLVYAGLVNKQLVAGLQAAGCNALGLSGADGNAGMARRRAPEPIDYGFVGAGPGRITHNKGRPVVERNIPQEEALDRLAELIKKNGDWTPA